MQYWIYYSTQLAFWFLPDQYDQTEKICIGGVPVTKSFSGGAALKYFYMIHRVGRTAPKSFWVQVFHCCGVKQPGAGGVVWKATIRAPSKLDCALVTFKFNNQKITPKTTLNKHWCLFRVIFSVFFWLLNLNITNILYCRWKPLQSSTK